MPRRKSSEEKERRSGFKKTNQVAENRKHKKKIHRQTKTKQRKLHPSLILTLL